METCSNKVSRDSHPMDSIINVGKNIIGSNKITIIAGPCSVESEDQIVNIAESVKSSGATFLRGGCF